MNRGLLPVLLFLLACAGPAPAAPIDLKAINEAQLSAKRGQGLNPAIIKAQVLLARAHFSPGVIDGRDGENFKKALAAFASASGSAGGKLTKELFDRLAATSSEPVLQEYTIAEADLKGPFVPKIPAKMEDMAKLDHLAHRNPLEALAEKFHMDEGLLKALNPGKPLDKAGTAIVVASLKDDKTREKASKLVVEKSARTLRALDKGGKLIAYFPASIGSQEKPAPSGTHKIERVAQNPSYTYNPKYTFKGVKSDKPFTIKPGPNNPVGAVWIALSVEGYGIHGTPDAAKVGKSFSHGCVRLTNWDATELAAMIEKGTPVEFVD
jgi:lipoprotein-anchoring transpeptidase ErfK/SrfK